MDRRSFLVGGASAITWAGMANRAYSQVFRGRVPNAPFQPYWEIAEGLPLPGLVSRCETRHLGALEPAMRASACR